MERGQPGNAQRCQARRTLPPALVVKGREWTERPGDRDRIGGVADTGQTRVKERLGAWHFPEAEVPDPIQASFWEQNRGGRGPGFHSSPDRLLRTPG